MGQKYQIVNGVKCQVDVNGKLLIKGEGVYELPIASETQLGGVAPKDKVQGLEYNDVYVDGVGRLYAPKGDAYELPVATPSTLGGVKPNAKTEAMTAPVGVDSEGKLYVQPVQGPQGPQGEQGPEGPEGPEGPAGQDGQDGRDGTDGTNGTSAYATVSKSGNTATITCTDANGTTTAQISDGETGATGATGPQGPQGPQGIQGVQGPQGPAGVGVPTGGTTGQYLKKKSGTDYDTEWGDVEALPTGGNNGDVLTKATTGPMWAPPVKELPTYTSAEAGKILGVNSGGTGVEWVNAGSGGGLPEKTSGTNSILFNEKGWDEHGDAIFTPQWVDYGSPVSKGVLTCTGVSYDPDTSAPIPTLEFQKPVDDLTLSSTSISSLIRATINATSVAPFYIYFNGDGCKKLNNGLPILPIYIYPTAGSLDVSLGRHDFSYVGSDLSYGDEYTLNSLYEKFRSEIWNIGSGVKKKMELFFRPIVVPIYCNSTFKIMWIISIQHIAFVAEYQKTSGGVESFVKNGHWELKGTYYCLDGSYNQSPSSAIGFESISGTEYNALIPDKFKVTQTYI